MADKQSPEYWHERIRQDGANAIERRLPKMEGKKREAAEQALSEHENAAEQGAKARQEQREEKTLKLAEGANSLSQQANRRALWANIIAAGAFFMALVSAIAVWVKGA